VSLAAFLSLFLAQGLAMAVGLNLDLPVELVEQIAERAAELLAERGVGASVWMDVNEAAVYLRCPASRIYALTSGRNIPHHHDGSRLLFRRSELDEWIRGGGGKRS
jgi:excisionase family DNA binding protein